MFGRFKHREKGVGAFRFGALGKVTEESFHGHYLINDYGDTKPQVASPRALIDAKMRFAFSLWWSK